MATGIENYPQIDAANAAYPKGSIKNDTGANDGTPVNKLVYDDHHQTLMKLLSLADITANGLPDNATNGYQYVEALDKLYKPFIDTVYINATTSLTFADFGKQIRSQATANIQLVLPNKNDLRNGDLMAVFNEVDFDLQVLGSGAALNKTLKRNGDFLIVQLDKPNSKWNIVVVFINNSLPTVTVGSGGGAPAYTNGWGVGSPLTFRKNQNGSVSFQGSSHHTAGNAAVIFTLPVGYRPSVVTGIPCLTLLSGTTYVPNVLVIDPTGIVYLGTTPGGVNTYVYFEGISFLL